MFGKQTTHLVASVCATCPFESEIEAIYYEEKPRRRWSCAFHFLTFVSTDEGQKAPGGGRRSRRKREGSGRPTEESRPGGRREAHAFQ